MSKKYNIRWRESDDAELSRRVKNFNSKIAYTEKAHPELKEYLPKRVTKKELKDSIQTRSDFNRKMNALERFSRRGATNPVKSSRGAKSTKWEVAEFNREQAILNRMRAKEREKLNDAEMKSRGQPIGYKRKEMGTERENALKPSKKNFDNLSGKEWELARKSIDNQLNAQYRKSKKEQLRQNYITAMQQHGVSNEIIKTVQAVDIDKFIEIFYTDKDSEIAFEYDTQGQKERNKALKGVWNNALNS